jgi:opacity protein-like surface antigen
VKKIFVLVVAAALMLYSSAVLGAGMKGKIGLSGRGGISFPIGDFAEEGSFATTISDSLFEIGMRERGSANMGWGFGFAVEYFVTDNIAVGGYFDYQGFGMDLDAMKEEFESTIPDTLADLAVGVEGDHRIRSIGVFGKYVFEASPKLSPFLKLGLGMGRLSSTGEVSLGIASGSEELRVILDAERESGMQFCFDMGGGLMYQLSGSVWITGEFLYRHLGTKGSEGDVDLIATAELGDLREQLFHEQWDDEFDFNADRLDIYLGISYFFGGAK